MAEFSTTLYDTAVFGVAANTEHVLFQVTQGADATHTEAFTNMRGNGSLPQQESFTIQRIKFIVDCILAAADIPKVFNGSFLELRISDETVFKAPLVMCLAHSHWGGAVNLAVAADKVAAGIEGNGYYLELPIELPGGTSFRVRVVQTLATAGASMNMKVVLDGKLKTSK